MSLRIFIVEDNADTFRALKVYLERRGHTVSYASCMTDALATGPKAGSNYDMLLSDIGLPDGDGWELLRRLKPDARCYAVAMSGYGTDDDISRSNEVGFHSHLIKPFTKGTLDAVLEQAARFQERAAHCQAA